MYIHEGHHIGDAWYYVDDDADRVHMFYLTRPLGSDGRHDVGHAVSRDLVHWDRLATVLKPGSPGSWDDLQLCTGSVMRRDGRYWLAYAATDHGSSSTAEPWRFQRGGMAVSDDLQTWQRLPENPVNEPGPPHYEAMGTGQREMGHWRDPFLFEHDGDVYQFICARRRDGDIRTRGTVALARSDDMRNWEVLPPIEHDRIAEEMEVPQVYAINGRWYLVFCTCGRFLSAEFAARFAGPIPDRLNLAMVADAPFGPYRIHGTGEMVPHAPEVYFYAAQLVHFQGSWHLLGTRNGDGPDRICDPVPVTADATGVHGSRRVT